MPDSGYYVHGTEPEEQERLTTLNDLMNEGSLREMKLRPGERILDVGAGLAQLARAMARTTGVKVLGVERSTDQINEALRQARAAGEGHLIELREGDALSLPLSDGEAGSFDLAHARFLLEHLPDPLGAARAMVGALRQGGRIFIEDDDHDLLRLWPEPPGLMPVWHAYIRSYDRAGNDPFVGRRLVQLLHQAGAEPRRNGWLFFGSCANGPGFDAFVRNLSSILEGARQAVVATGVTDDEVTGAIASLDAWKRRPDAAFWYAISFAEGVRM